MPTVSLIITTYNQPEILRIVLESVFRQRRPPDEIVVADDGSGEETAELIRKMSEAAPVALRNRLWHVWHPDDGFRVASIRNNAVAVSTGEYLIFLDGDCYVNEHFVGDHLSLVRPGQYIVGTRVNIKPARKEYILRENDLKISLFSWGTSKRIHAIRSPFLSRFRQRGGMASANFSMWRSDFENVNGFNERFNGHGGVDADLARRLDHAGIVLKKMVFLGMAYHFAHPAAARGNTRKRLNEVWDSTPEEEKIRCRLGLDRALKEGVTILNR